MLDFIKVTLLTGLVILIARGIYMAWQYYA